MASQSIKLGDQIEDVTSKSSGIAIARVEYLSGAVAWIIQPFTTDDNVRLNTIEVEDAYCLHIGAGVYPDPKPPMGFNARNETG